MRTTKQIDNLAESIRMHNDAQLGEDDKSLRAIPEREGAVPWLIHLKDQAAEKKYVIRLVKQYLQKSDRITIGIVGSKNSQLSTFSSWLTDAGIPHEQVTRDSTFSMKKPGVKVVTAFGAKGLEFHVVIIPMFAQGYYPYGYKTDDPEELDSFMVQMRNLVYVSMTRAKGQLVITYWGKNGSQFIGEMDPTMYVQYGEPIEGSYARPIKVTASPSADSPVVNADEGETHPGQEKASAGSRPKTLPSSDPDKNGTPEKTVQEDTLLAYLKNVPGVTVRDYREKGGGLWISGGKEVLDSVKKETGKKFGAFWIYSEKRGGYFTKCKK